MSILACRPKPAVAAVLALSLALILLPAPIHAGGEGIITTVAGTGSWGYSGDGVLAVSASLAGPDDVAIDNAGNFFIADGSNCRVRMVSGGIITTVAGNGDCAHSGDGGPATGAGLSYTSGLAVDSAGNLSITDFDNCRVREVRNGTINVAVGNGSCGYSGDGGPAGSASLNGPMGVAADRDGSLYIADFNNCRVRKVRAGIITTVAGDGSCVFSGDSGPATSAGLAFPVDVAADLAGNLYVADYLDCRVRKITDGIITTMAGDGLCSYGGDGGPPTSASLAFPGSVAVDAIGNVYIGDDCRVRMVSGGVITTVAGTGSCGFSGDGWPATSAKLSGHGGIAVAGSKLYIADTGNSRVRRVVMPCAVAVDPDCSGDIDFYDPGPGLPCIQDHGEDANGDGYSDSDEFTRLGEPACTGAFPISGGFGRGPASACPGRSAGSMAAAMAHVDVDLDGSVTILDLATVASQFQKSYQSQFGQPDRTSFLAELDQDGEGQVNMLDLAAVARFFGQSVPAC